MKPRALTAFFCLLGFGFISAPVQAQVLTRYWDINGPTAGAGGITPAGTWDGSSNNWTATSAGTATATTWSSGAVAVFGAGTDATGVYTITVSGSQTIAGLTVEEGTPSITGGSLSFTAATAFNIGTTATINSVLTGTGGDLGKTGSGTLTLSGTNTYTGGTNVIAGTLELTGSISHAASDTLVNSTVGPTLNITSGGDLNTGRLRIGITDNTHSGTVSVTDAGSTVTNSTYLYVGEAGTGTLTIASGGSVTGPNTSIGNNFGGIGTVSVTGAGSTLNNTNTLYAGSAGNGTLTVTNGGTVTNLHGIVGNNIGGKGSVTIDGASSTWTNTSTLTVGSSGTGSLTLSNSGRITVNSGTGTVTLGAIGSSGTLNIGAAMAGTAAAGGIVNAAMITTGTGSGTLQFKTTATSGTPYYLTKDGNSGGAAVVIAGPTSLINTAGYNVLTGANTYTGTTTITGGTLVAGSNSAFGTSAVTLNGGKLNVASGVNFGNTLGIGVNGGTLAGNGNFTSPLTLGTGVTLAPGNSVGTLNFASGLTLNNGGTLDIEIQAPTGTPGTNWDLLDVTGTLNLGGLSAGGYTLKAISLDLSGNPGAVSGLTGPASWTIAITTAISGFQATDFAIDFSQFTGGGNFTLSQSGNNLMLNFTPVPEPSTYALMAAGLIVAGLGYRRRKNRSA